MAPGGVELRPGRSLELRESQELQNGGLRALEEAWTMTSRLRHFLSSLIVFCASEGDGGLKLKARGSRVEAQGQRLEAQGWRLEAQS